MEKILEKRKQEIQQAEKEEKDKKAVEEYDRWLVFYFLHFVKTKKINVVMSVNTHFVYCNTQVFHAVMRRQMMAALPCCSPKILEQNDDKIWWTYYLAYTENIFSLPACCRVLNFIVSIHFSTFHVRSNHL